MDQAHHTLSVQVQALLPRKPQGGLVCPRRHKRLLSKPCNTFASLNGMMPDRSAVDSMRMVSRASGNETVQPLTSERRPFSLFR
ncbi:hypothetical protein ACKLNR_005547 [Fusarium oxysporum f. sp. zingiberi]